MAITENPVGNEVIHHDSFRKKFEVFVRQNVFSRVTDLWQRTQEALTMGKGPKQTEEATGLENGGSILRLEAGIAIDTPRGFFIPNKDLEVCCQIQGSVYVAHISEIPGISAEGNTQAEARGALFCKLILEYRRLKIAGEVNEELFDSIFPESLQEIRKAS
jgi:hypothetical protein